MTADVLPDPLSTLLRAPAGAVNLAALDTRATPGYPGEGKADADAHREALAPQLADLQELLFADGRANPEGAKRVLMILQGMDTSGKGGIMRHAIGLVDPQGVHIKAFKAPTAEERRHHYLWRIEKALPEPGMIGIFDRSQYEDVLVVRVESLVPKAEWEKRYDEINAFELKLVEQGYTLIKCYLHMSKEEQAARLQARLDDPHKHWKFNPGDIDARAKWDAYMEAYTAVLERTNTDYAPWYVLPADRKWYRNWAAAALLREKLAGLNLTWPVADFDVDEQKARLAAEG